MSPEFFERYAALLATTQVAPRTLAEGSVGELIRDYKSSEDYTALADKTRRDYARMLDLLAPVGAFPVGEIKRRHIRELRKPLLNRSRTAKLFTQVASKLFAFAIDNDLIDVNPAAKMKRLGEPKSYLAWSDEDCAAFEKSLPPAALLTAYMLARYAGQREGDVLRMARTAYDGTGLTVRQAKTGVALWIPVHARLKIHLDALPSTTLLFVTKPAGTAYEPSTFRHAFRDALDAAGLEHLHFHGLRHTAGRALAEAGCTEKEIQSILGHLTPAMSHHYTSQAGQKKLATKAIAKLQRTRPEHESG